MTRILLVEDDFAIVHSLQEYLNLEGFSSDYASGQKEELIFDISEAEEAGKGFRANAKPFQDEFTAE